MAPIASYMEIIVQVHALPGSVLNSPGPSHSSLVLCACQPYWLFPLPPPQPSPLPLIFLLLLLEGPYLEFSSLHPYLCLANSYSSFISQLKITSSRNSPDAQWTTCPRSLSVLLSCSSLHFFHSSLRIHLSFLLVQTLFCRL